MLLPTLEAIDLAIGDALASMLQWAGEVLAQLGVPVVSLQQDATNVVSFRAETPQLERPAARRNRDICHWLLIAGGPYPPHGTALPAPSAPSKRTGLWLVCLEGRAAIWLQDAAVVYQGRPLLARDTQLVVLFRNRGRRPLRLEHVPDLQWAPILGALTEAGVVALGGGPIFGALELVQLAQNAQDFDGMRRFQAAGGLRGLELRRHDEAGAEALEVDSSSAASFASRISSSHSDTSESMPSAPASSSSHSSSSSRSGSPASLPDNEVEQDDDDEEHPVVAVSSATGSSGVAPAEEPTGVAVPARHPLWAMPELVAKILMATMGLDDETMYRSSERWRGAVRGAVHATRLCKEIRLAATPLLQSHVERLVRERWLCRDPGDSQTASTGQLLVTTYLEPLHACAAADDNFDILLKRLVEAQGPGSEVEEATKDLLSDYEVVLPRAPATHAELPRLSMVVPPLRLRTWLARKMAEIVAQEQTPQTATVKEVYKSLEKELKIKARLESETRILCPGMLFATTKFAKGTTGPLVTDFTIAICSRLEPILEEKPGPWEIASHFHVVFAGMDTDGVAWSPAQAWMPNGVSLPLGVMTEGPGSWPRSQDDLTTWASTNSRIQTQCLYFGGARQMLRRMLLECAGHAITHATRCLHLAGPQVKQGPQWDNWLHRTVALPLVARARAEALRSTLPNWRNEGSDGRNTGRNAGDGAKAASTTERFAEHHVLEAYRRSARLTPGLAAQELAEKLLLSLFMPQPAFLRVALPNSATPTTPLMLEGSNAQLARYAQTAMFPWYLAVGSRLRRLKAALIEALCAAIHTPREFCRKALVQDARSPPDVCSSRGRAENIQARFVDLSKLCEAVCKSKLNEVLLTPPELNAAGTAAGLEVKVSWLQSRTADEDLCEQRDGYYWHRSILRIQAASGEWSFSFPDSGADSQRLYAAQPVGFRALQFASCPVALQWTPIHAGTLLLKHKCDGRGDHRCDTERDAGAGGAGAGAARLDAGAGGAGAGAVRLDAGASGAGAGAVRLDAGASGAGAGERARASAGKRPSAGSGGEHACAPWPRPIQLTKKAGPELARTASLFTNVEKAIRNHDFILLASCMRRNAPAVGHWKTNEFAAGRSLLKREAVHPPSVPTATRAPSAELRIAVAAERVLLLRLATKVVHPDAAHPEVPVADANRALDACVLAYRAAQLELDCLEKHLDAHETAAGKAEDTDDGEPCFICGESQEAEENALVLCERCNAYVHQRCHDPPVASAALGESEVDWQCGWCASGWPESVAYDVHQCRAFLTEVRQDGETYEVCRMCARTHTLLDCAQQPPTREPEAEAVHDQRSARALKRPRDEELSDRRALTLFDATVATQDLSRVSRKEASGARWTAAQERTRLPAGE